MFQRIVLLSALCAFAASAAASQSPNAPARATSSPPTQSASRAKATQQPRPAAVSAPAPPQTRTPSRTPQPPTPAPAAPVKRHVNQPINLRIELAITDQRGGSAPVKKTITAVIADGHNGMIRAESQIAPNSSVPLHMDASPEILDDGKIRVNIGLQYDLPRLATSNTEPGLTNFSPNKMELRENVTLILESGKPIVVTQSADPMSDRQVTVEVKVTILR